MKRLQQPYGVPLKKAAGASESRPPSLDNTGSVKEEQKARLEGGGEAPGPPCPSEPSQAPAREREMFPLGREVDALSLY